MLIIKTGIERVKESVPEAEGAGEPMEEVEVCLSLACDDGQCLRGSVLLTLSDDVCYTCAIKLNDINDIEPEE